MFFCFIVKTHLTSAGDVKNQFTGISRTETTIAVIRSCGEEHEVKSNLLVYETEPSSPVGRPPDQRSRD